MGIIENSLIGIGLSMDAFMISFSKGYTWNKIERLILSIFFGLFQFFMTYLGYYFGKTFLPVHLPYKNVLLFFILLYIGINMMRQKTEYKSSFHIGIVLLLSVLTSLDAFSIGISLTLYKDNIIKISGIIGIITFILSWIGSRIGNWMNQKFMKNSNRIGGFIIILYAIKVLLSK